MSDYLNMVRRAWAKEHDPDARQAYEAMQAARAALAAAEGKPAKRAARKAMARAEHAYCEAVSRVPIVRGATLAAPRR